KFDFPNERLPGVEGFDKTEEILASEPDINPGMIEPQRQARETARAAADPAQRAHVEEVIRRRAIPVFMSESPKMGRVANVWIRPRIVGNYRGDYLMRTIANFTGIWANNAREVVYFAGQGIDGNRTFTQTFPANAMPASKARYFWSVVAVDSQKFQVIPNPLNRYLLNKQSALQVNDDGSLTLVFGPKQPVGLPEANWLPTPAGKTYNLTYRFYGPSKDIIDGTYYPPTLVRK